MMIENIHLAVHTVNGIIRWVNIHEHHIFTQKLMLALAALSMWYVCLFLSCLCVGVAVCVCVKMYFFSILMFAPTLFLCMYILTNLFANRWTDNHNRVNKIRLNLFQVHNYNFAFSISACVCVCVYCSRSCITAIDMGPL